MLHVRDNGCGIAPSSLPRIFDPFYTTKSVGQGTGLGLSIVKSIAEAHGGTARVESEGRNRGSRFTFSIPRTLV